MKPNYSCNEKAVRALDANNLVIEYEQKKQPRKAASFNIL